MFPPAVYEGERGIVRCVPLCLCACMYCMRTFVHVREQEESLGRLMLTVGWPWGSQSSSCRWRGWLSASLPTRDGSFIIIRHTVKRCSSGPQNWVVRLWICPLASVCVHACITESERQQDRDRKGSLISYDKRCTSEHMCLSACVCHRCACLCFSCWTCLSISWWKTRWLSVHICLLAVQYK